jgi:xylulose-5-phosphate/fructose-6-phosphate phosphoketolase
LTPATIKVKGKTGNSKSPAAGPLSAEDLRKIDAYWRASNYLSVGQIYLLDNPLLRESLKREHIKPRLLGHWGTSPGLNMFYVHLNRVIKRSAWPMIVFRTPKGWTCPPEIEGKKCEGYWRSLVPMGEMDKQGRGPLRSDAVHDW